MKLPSPHLSYILWQMDYSQLYNMAVRTYAKLPYSFAPRRAFRPLTLFLEVTYRCNFRCNMCQFLPILDAPELKQRQQEELSTQEMKSCIDETSSFGLIAFTGGEPLLRKDMPELLDYAAGNRKAYLVTNGMLLRQEMAKQMAELGCNSVFGKGLVSVGISVEAPGSLHDEIVKVPGAFDKVMDNMRGLIEQRNRLGKKFPLVALKCVMTESNVDRLEELFHLAKDAGADIFNPISLYHMTEPNRLDMSKDPQLQKKPMPTTGMNGNDIKEKLVQIKKMADEAGMQLRVTPPGLMLDDVADHYNGGMDMKKMVCYTPWTTAIVSAYGDVLPCSSYPAGNIRKEKFMDIWNGERMAKFRLGLKRASIYPICEGCCNMERL